MLTLLRTWQLGDVSRVQAVGPSLQGDLAGVLSSITAKGLIMPCKTDLYFPVSGFIFKLLHSLTYEIRSRKTVRTRYNLCVTPNYL